VTKPRSLAELYPEVAKAGSLAAAIQAVAEANGLELGVMAASETRPLLTAVVDSATAERGELHIFGSDDERSWTVSGKGHGIELVHGCTRDLAEAARAAQCWRHGVPLLDIVTATPFLDMGGPAWYRLAAEHGPEHVVATRWLWLRRKAADVAGWPEFRALVEAAHAEPKLRQFFPVLSHWLLSFSTHTGFPFSPGPTVRAGRLGVPYEVWQGNDLIEEAATAEEAAALAVGLLPDDVGPAVAGPYRASR
jgi:hypothetical protein